MIADLLDLSSELAARGGDTGRPRSVDLRRATSTAYYALFHALSRLCATQLVGSSKPWSVVSPIYRSLDHRKAREVLSSYRKDPAASPIASIALAFAVLQDARHEADYNPEPFRYNRGGTIDLVGTARQAIARLDRLPPDMKLALAVKLVAKSR